ncbi:MAG: electron transfer flavoprotein subunit beta/FixA family protein [Pseudomonadota bacterium]
MPLKIIVTVKQVPDTHNITCNAMKADGTVNRAALPAIFNPEDLNALEAALDIKDRLGAHVTAISMGPPAAVAVLRDCLFRGADDAVLVSDRRFAGADTLATSYALACAIEKCGPVDLICCGRQAIDGDTAQVGPQIAEKLAMNQISSVAGIREVSENAIVVARSVESGTEILSSGYPVLLTITTEANDPRPPSARRVMAFKAIDRQACDGSYESAYLEPDSCRAVEYIREWNADTIGADPARCGLSGSPTKVKTVENVVLAASSMQRIAATREGIAELVHELVRDNILG